ncbi:MAG: GNAT family N-acetyltransferase [Lachnospiraceae bacterium]|nr:GNAT family N-acetyltransferase [Lachnospiraceae bacterium]
MGEINVFAISKDEAGKASAFLMPEVLEALKAGLPVTSLIAVDSEEALGALAGAIDGEVFEIKSLYVSPGKRRMGAGRALVESLEELLSETDIVIRAQYTVENEDNAVLMPFFKSMGFKEDPLETPAFLTGYLEDLHITGTGEKPEMNILTFSEVSKQILKVMTNTCIKNGYPVPEEGFASDKLDGELSLCAMKGMEGRAYVTTEILSEELVFVSTLWTLPEYAPQLMVMLERLIKGLK